MTDPAPSHPLTDPIVVDSLGTDLRAAGYDVDGVAQALGDAAHAALAAGTWWPAQRACAAAQDDSPSLVALIRLFLLAEAVSESAVRQAFPTTSLDDLLRHGVLRQGVQRHEALGPAADSTFVSALDIRPYADDAGSYLVISDQDAGLRDGPVTHDHVLGIGGASISLARAVIRRPAARALDLGTGCGVQALHLHAHAEHIVATDTNDRALALARATAQINGMSWDLRTGSLFDPVAGEVFDLIVSNPPFVVGTGSQDYIYRDSGISGDGLCAKLIADLPGYLAPGGTATVLANWMVFDADDWQARPREWFDGYPLDAWVVQRELADPISYISLWLADAGETAESVAARANTWAQWFERNGVVGIGMGVITLRAKEFDDESAPIHVIEEITGAGEEVTGVEAEAFLARQRYLAAVTDDQVLELPLSTAPVLLEEQSLPGEQGWQAISHTVRRPGGPGAVLGLDEVSKALLAGCRGEVPLGTLIELLAGFHGVEADALAQAAMPVVREAIARGILHEVQRD
ncbi:methyltransferase [Gordonia sp. TBRC 11910]|uniref:Methyltransferase n=1 Tax=Gordonia asplenii TaxID=2725283 RepID=A0A848KZC9_9ACTN|nr:methyltransferase [Gordonia asplenii]NMO03749.1 methyltransferase [Gordonia asplenii]